MRDITSIVERMVELNQEKMKFEQYLKYAKDKQTVDSLNKSIETCNLKIDIYLMLL